MLLLKIKLFLFRFGIRMPFGLADYAEAKEHKGFIMDKGAIKEMMYGGIKELMSNRRYYYKSSVSRDYSQFTPEGVIAVQEFVLDMSKYISAAEEQDLDQRAKDLVMKELKS